jgi:hypothetical protein
MRHRSAWARGVGRRRRRLGRPSRSGAPRLENAAGCQFGSYAGSGGDFEERPRHCSRDSCEANDQPQMENRRKKWEALSRRKRASRDWQPNGTEGSVTLDSGDAKYAARAAAYLPCADLTAISSVCCWHALLAGSGSESGSNSAILLYPESSAPLARIRKMGLQPERARTIGRCSDPRSTPWLRPTHRPR